MSPAFQNDQKEALKVADRVVLMHHGRVQRLGTPREVDDRPVNAFVHGFLGVVNRFDAHAAEGPILVDGNRRRRAALGPGDEEEILVFAHPHELTISTAPGDADGVPARVERVLAIGAAAHVALPATLRGVPRSLEVALSLRDAERLDLRTGATVRVVASRVAVFARCGKQEKEALRA